MNGPIDSRLVTKMLMEEPVPVRTREYPLACGLLKGIASPCWLQELVVSRRAACKGSDSEKCTREHFD